MAHRPLDSSAGVVERSRIRRRGSCYILGREGRSNTINETRSRVQFTPGGDVHSRRGKEDNSHRAYRGGVDCAGLAGFQAAGDGETARPRPRLVGPHCRRRIYLRAGRRSRGVSGDSGPRGTGTCYTVGTTHAFLSPRNLPALQSTRQRHGTTLPREKPTPSRNAGEGRQVQ